MVQLVKRFSRFPFDDFDGDLGVFGHERLLKLQLSRHLLQLVEGLLKLLSGRRVLGTGSDKLDRVEPGLLVQFVEQLNDIVELVQIVDLNFSFFQLRQRGQSAHSTRSDLLDYVGQHIAERRDRFSLNRAALAQHVVGDGAQILGGHLPDVPVL